MPIAHCLVASSDMTELSQTRLGCRHAGYLEGNYYTIPCQLLPGEKLTTYVAHNLRTFPFFLLKSQLFPSKFDFQLVSRSYLRGSMQISKERILVDQEFVYDRRSILQLFDSNRVEAFQQPVRIRL